MDSRARIDCVGLRRCAVGVACPIDSIEAEPERKRLIIRSLRSGKRLEPVGLDRRRVLERYPPVGAPPVEVANSHGLLLGLLLGLGFRSSGHRSLRLGRRNGVGFRLRLGIGRRGLGLGNLAAPLDKGIPS